MLVAGLVFLAIAAGLFAAGRSQKRKLEVLEKTETLTTADLKSRAAAQAGGRNFRQLAEVKGKIECAAPLSAELSGTPCVHYSMRVTREFEETTFETDPDGNQIRKTRRGSDTVAENTRSVPFEVVDPSGRIQVDPNGAAMTADNVLSRFDPADSYGRAPSLGSFALDARRLPPSDPNRVVTGYRYEEQAIPVGREVFVLGEAAGSPPEIRKPENPKARFIISLRSEESLKRSAGSAIGFLRAAAGLAGLAGLIMSLAAALRLV